MREFVLLPEELKILLEMARLLPPHYDCFHAISAIKTTYLVPPCVTRYLARSPPSPPHHLHLADRMYLESLLEDGDLIEPSYPVHKTAKREITKAINYLDSKADYWQRYKPIYARVGDRGVEKKRATGEELALQVREG